MENLSIFVGSAVGRNNNGLTISGGGLWYGVDDPRNTSFRIQEDEPQNVRTAEIIATLLAVQKTSREQALILHSSRSTVRVAMSCLLATEDRGWIKMSNKKLLQALASELKARTGTTLFEDGDPRANKQELAGRAQATQPAKDGCQDAMTRPIVLNQTLLSHCTVQS
jgi:hypothetical protein